MNWDLAAFSCLVIEFWVNELADYAFDFDANGSRFKSRTGDEKIINRLFS